MLLSELRTSTKTPSLRTLRRGSSIRLTQDRVASGKVSTLSIKMGSRCRLLGQATGVEDKYRLIGILSESNKKGFRNIGKATYREEDFSGLGLQEDCRRQAPL